MVLEGRTEKPEAASSSVSSPMVSQAGDEEPRGGGGVTVDVPGAVVASEAGGTVSEARADEICSVIARM
jgi:hypothetical protein